MGLTSAMSYDNMRAINRLRIKINVVINMRKYIRDVSIEMLGSIFGALILSLLFFVVSDFFFKPPNLNGRWRVGTLTESTKHNPFRDLIVFYDVILHQDGNHLEGTAEMVGELASGKPLVYDYAKRAQVKFSGSIDRNYLKKDKVNIHWFMHGEKRDSSTFFDIVRFNDHYMQGTFVSTIAANSGRTEWVRNFTQFSWIPTKGWAATE
jgi:hypothetical protein